MMTITVRFYRQHDLDLVVLFKTPGFPKTKIIKRALYSFLDKKTEPFIEVKDIVYPPYIPPVVTFQLVLNEKKDPRLIEVYSHVKQRFRGAFTKAVLREYTSHVELSAFLDSTSFLTSLPQPSVNPEPSGVSLSPEWQKKLSEPPAEEKPAATVSPESEENTSSDFDIFGAFQNLMQ